MQEVVMRFGGEMRRAKKLIVLFLALGLASSLYLLKINFNQTVCLPNETCVHENGLIYASLGAVWFLTGIILNIKIKRESLIALWAVTGFAGIFYFWSIMIQENYFCLYCFIAHTSGGLAGILAIWSLKDSM